MKKCLIALLFLVVVTLALGHPLQRRNRNYRKKVSTTAKPNDHDGIIALLKGRIDKVSYRAGKLENDLDARVDPERIQRAKSLRNRVQNIVGSGCRPDYFQCGRNEPQCVNNLLVCDGHKDCRNGADEDNCQSPLEKGDIFVGSVIFDNCNLGELKTIQFEVKSVETSAFFKPIVRLAINLEITKDTDHTETELILVSQAHYELASHRLVLQPTGSNRLGLFCRFDGSNLDECTGGTISEASQQTCAKYHFTRKQATDHDDDDDN